MTEKTREQLLEKIEKLLKDREEKLEKYNKLYEEYAKVNNELLNANRKLSKRNRQLEKIRELLEKEVAERKRVEEKLRFQSELIDQIQDSVIATDLEGRILFVNRGAARLLKTEPGELLGKSVKTLGDDPEKGETQESIIDKTLKNANWSGIVVNYAKNGSERIYESRTWITRDKQGNPTGMVGVSTDITQRKRAEERIQKQNEEIQMQNEELRVSNEELIETAEKLRNSERRLKEAQKTGRIGHVEFDVKTGDIIWADVIYELFERDPDLGPPTYEEIFALHHPKDAERLEKSVKLAIDEAISYKIELRVNLPSGKNGYYYAIGKPVLNNKGEVIKVIGTVQDITERKKAKEDFEAVFNMATDLICVADINTATFTRVNPAFERVLGYTKEELLSRPFLDFVHPEDIKSTVEVIEEKLQQGQKVIFFQNRYRCKDGSYRWLDWNSNPIVEKGKTYAIAHDVTEKKRTEEALKKANATKDQFLSLIAHDLRNPIMVLTKSSEIMITYFDSLKEQEMMKFLKNMHKTSLDLEEKFENLLRWTWYQTESIDFKPEKLDLRLLVENNIGKWEKRAKEKNLDLNIAITEKIYAQADEDMVKTIVNNLFSNAIRHTLKGGNVEIGSMERQEFVEIAVRDSGVGISPERQEKLFELDLDYIRKASQEGKNIGLGLLLCKEFVKKHGGEIWVESEVGKGSAFKFTLPKLRE